jgi:lipoprotein-releasing system permease protein
MPWYVHLALKQLFPAGRRFPFFTAISVLGVALGVALLIVVTSVMGGFGYEIRRMIVETEGEVQIKARGLIGESAPLLKEVSRVPGVQAATPYASGVVMVMANGRPAYPAIRGLDLATVTGVVELSTYIRLGTLDDLDDDSVLVSSELARSLGVTIGDTLEV